jgi:hypothetical protein
MSMMAMAVRGLYYHEFQEALPKTSPIEIVHVPWNMGLEMLARFGAFRDGDPIEKGNRVVFWKRMPVDGEPQDSSFWVVCFNDSVVFLGGTGNVAQYLINAREEAELSGVRQERADLLLPTSAKSDLKLPKDPSGNYLMPPSLRNH